MVLKLKRVLALPVTSVITGLLLQIPAAKAGTSISLEL
jgi:hypothetical protein